MRVAQAVWVGTRFVCAKEAGAPPRHQQAIVNADYHDTIRTIIFTGRPMRVLKNDYIMKWENDRQSDIKELTAKVTAFLSDLNDAISVAEREKKGRENRNQETLFFFFVPFFFF